MTKELENKLKISENTGIHCPTLELAKQVLNIFNDLGLKWHTDRSYIKHHNWDPYKDKTVYYPIEGTFSCLQFAQDENYKIIHAKEFIALHPFDLENYIPKGQLQGFPKEIIKRMLDYQEEQGNKRNVTIFEDRANVIKEGGGFSWTYTYEGFHFWNHVINYKNFDFFFEKYPKICHKEENNIILSNATFIQPCIDFNIPENQDFKVGDKVYDIMCKSSGIITNVNIGAVNYPLTAELENGKIINTYTIDGILNSYFKTPQLLHYRDDYDYNVIDFNNLPKRQEPKRWRANKGSCYWVIENFSVYKFKENNTDIDDVYNNLGNYFQSEDEAQEIANKLKDCFKQLIKEKHDNT